MQSRKFKLGCSLLVGTLLFSSGVFALGFGANIETSEWQVSSSVLECRLSQPVPHYGQGVFSRKAGDPLAFLLAGNQPLAEGRIKVVAEAPPWKPHLANAELGEVELLGGPRPLQIEAPISEDMLAALKSGMQPRLSGDNPRGTGVSISAVNFQAAYGEYAQCLAQLLPVGFRQIARSAIFFETNGSRLSVDVRAQLDLIIRYVKADNTVNRIFIDGHTDDTGNKRINKNLSRTRANQVTSYLAKAGVNKKIIVTRYHADKYPVVKNKTEDGRARNRRVTVRLERA